VKRALRERACAWSRQDNPREIQRIGQRDFNFFSGLTGPSKATQHVDSLGPRELLAERTCNEPSAADFSTRLPLAQYN
jgi:hypothetical protein